MAKKARLAPAPVPASVAQSSVAMSVSIPPEGLVLKIVSHGRVVGTLWVSEWGFRFAKANQKKTPTREVSWAVLKKLMETGLL